MVCLQINLFSQQRFSENISITNSYRKRNIFKVWKIVETFSGLCFALHILYLLQYIWWWWCLSSRAEQNMKQQQRKTQKEMAHVCVNQSEHSLATDPNQWESSSLECRTLNSCSNLPGLIHHSPLKQQNYLNHTGAFLVLKYFVSRTPIFSPPLSVLSVTQSIAKPLISEQAGRTWRLKIQVMVWLVSRVTQLSKYRTYRIIIHWAGIVQGKICSWIMHFILQLCISS